MLELSLVVAGFGLLFGSFINAVVWRLHEQGAGYEPDEIPKSKHKDISISKGRSVCPNCDHALSSLDLIPVFSWLALRGKCRYCRKPISLQYPLVELLTAALFYLSAQAMPTETWQNWLVLVVWLVTLVGLLILAVYDLHWMLLPDRVLVPLIIGTVISLLCFWLTGAVSGGSLINQLLSGIVAGGIFLTIVLVSRGMWMGGGDIKLVLLMGLILGGSKTALGMLIAFNSAAIIGVLLIVSGRKKRRDQLAFGPFLIFGTIIAQLYGARIVDWYLRLNGLG